MSPLGRFLEFSVVTDDILASLFFYKTLGFTEIDAGDAWAHKYAVVSDGELCIGLHEREARPAVTFVHRDLAPYARALADRGTRFDYLRLDEDVFNELGFSDPDGHLIALVEARTFSPTDEDIDRSLLGEWFETVLPVKNAVQAARFWAPLAPSLLRMREEPTPHMRFEASGLVLGLSESIALRRPSLCFKCGDPEAVMQALERHGVRQQPYPGFEGAFCEIRAPEGTSLFLFDQDFLGESYVVEESGEYRALT